jgi:hypothetical protein
MKVWWDFSGGRAMQLNAEVVASAVMTVAIAGVGLAWVALLLLL